MRRSNEKRKEKSMDGDIGVLRCMQGLVQSMCHVCVGAGVWVRVRGCDAVRCCYVHVW